MKQVCSSLWLVWLFPLVSFSQSPGDYQSRQSGDWGGNTTWQTYNGSAWVNTPAPPNSSKGVITIRSGHTVTVRANVTADQIFVANAATLIVGLNVTLSAGPHPSMLYVSSGGIVQNNSAVIQGTAASNFFDSGSIYIHNYTRNFSFGGNVPLATWHPSSVIRVIGFTGDTNYVLTSPGWSQSFGNFVFASSQRPNRTVNFNGLLTNIQGNFTISYFGNGGSVFAFSVDQNYSLTVVGNFNIGSGVPTDRRIMLRTAAAGSTTLNIGGNFSYLGGSLDLASSSSGTFNLNGSAVQTFSRTANFPTINGKLINLTIAPGAVVDFGTSSFNGLGSFTLSGTMRTGAAGGLTTTLANSGSKTFDANSTIVYNGTVAQVMGSPYPGNPAAGIHVVIDNPAGVTTSAPSTPATSVTAVTGNLALQSGTLTVSGVHTLQLDGTVSGTGNIAMSAGSNLIINGTGPLGVDPFPFPADQTFNNFTLNRSGSTVTLANNITLNGAVMLAKGTLSGGTSVITMQGTTWSVDGVSGGFFAPGTSTVIFNGNTAVTFGTDFNNVQLTATGTLTFPAEDVNISGNIDFASGSVFNPLTGSVVLNGGIDQSINSNGTEFYTIQINKGGGVVNTGSPLSVRHLLDIQSPTAFNSNGNLTLLSLGITTDLDGSIGPVPTGANINGNVNVQRYMDPIGNKYRYLASPVNGALPPASWGSNIYEYKYTSGTGSWSQHSTSSPLTLGAGYAVLKDMSTPITWSVAGPVSYGSFTWNFGAEGWYLIGNPFPSAIRWFNPGVAWDTTNIATTIAVTDNSVSGYPNYFRYYSLNPADNPNWGTGELTNGVVSMGQSFWVYAGAGGGSLTVYESAKENSQAGEFYRTQLSEPSNLLKLSLDNGKLADVAYLKLNPRATVGYEFRHDLKKLKNEDMNISLKDPNGNELVINSIDKLEKRMQIPLEIEVKEKGTFTLSFGFAESFPYGNSLYLIDTYEGKSWPISEGTYSFSINESTRSYKGRFYLSLDNALPERRLTDIIETYPNPVLDKLNVRIPDNEIVTIHLTDSQGKEFLSHEVRGSVEIDMHDYPKGMYVVRILTEEGILVRKVVR